MKKIAMTLLMVAGLYATVDAASLTANTPFGELNLEISDGVMPPREVILPGATKMSGSFPVTFDDGISRVTFPVYFDNEATLEDIVTALWNLFNR